MHPVTDLSQQLYFNKTKEL